MWGEQDSNLRSRKTTELQSVLVGRLSISPIIDKSHNFKSDFLKIRMHPFTSIKT